MQGDALFAFEGAEFGRPEVVVQALRFVQDRDPAAVEAADDCRGRPAHAVEDLDQAGEIGSKDRVMRPAVRGQGHRRTAVERDAVQVPLQRGAGGGGEGDLPAQGVETDQGVHRPVVPGQPALEPPVRRVEREAAEAAALRGPGELPGPLVEAQVVVQVDPGVGLLADQGRRAAGRGIEGEQLQPAPVAAQPLDEEAPVGVPVDAGQVVVVRGAQVEPAHVAPGYRGHAQPPADVVRPGERIAVLLDLDPVLPLVHDGIDRDVPLVHLLEGQPA